VLATETTVAITAKPAYVLYEHAEAPKPTVEDIDRFVLLFDTIGKRTYAFAELTTNILVKLRGKDCLLYVHAYGLKLGNSSMHKAMMAQFKPVSTDRAGAADLALQLDKVFND
jgi:hypothetical protein